MAKRAGEELEVATRPATRRSAVAGGGTIDDSDENQDAATAKDDGDARATAPTEEEAEKDENPAAAPGLLDEPKSVILTYMDCRVAIMAALANINPVSALYGESSKRLQFGSRRAKNFPEPLVPERHEGDLVNYQKSV